MKITHEPILKRLNHKWATEVRDMPRFRGDRNWKKPVTTTMKDKTGKGCARVEKLFQFGFNDVVEVD